MKNTTCPFIVLFLFALLAINCTPSTELPIEPNDAPMLSLTKERCRGYCPAYSMAFFANRAVKYSGLAHVAVVGEREFKIDKVAWDKLKIAFEKSKFDQYEKEYLTAFMDLPKMVLVYEGRQITFHEKAAPAEIVKLAQLVEDLLPVE